MTDEPVTRAQIAREDREARLNVHADYLGRQARRSLAEDLRATIAEAAEAAALRRALLLLTETHTTASDGTTSGWWRDQIRALIAAKETL